MSSIKTGFRLQQGMSVSENGHLCLDQVSLVDLADRYGTPLYVISEQTIREHCQQYQQSLRRYYPNSTVAYASKAFLCQAICRIVESEGMSLDIVSGGELYTAQSAGFPGERIIFHGIDRSLTELTAALNYGVGRIVVDNLGELERVALAARQTGTTAQVLLRTTTGIAAHTHHYVQTSLFDSKFGFQLAELPKIAEMITHKPEISVVGLHCHLGSQIMTGEPFVENLRILLTMAKSLSDGREALSEINVGGGLGVYYTEGDDPLAIEPFVKQLATAAQEICSDLEIAPPHIILEPGRSIINEAGLTLYRVGGSKQIPGVRNYVFIDGSMSDNIRPALYGSKYEAVLANRMHDVPELPYSIAGRCCESGDMIAFDQPLPVCVAGDLLAVARTGAYNYSMASNYNRLPRPGVVLVANGEHSLIVERESYEDVIRLDRLPPHLARS